jgi:hypothetical protein
MESGGKSEEARMATLSASGVWSKGAALAQPWVHGLEESSVGGLATEEGCEKRACGRRELHCPVQLIPLASDQNPHPADAISGECLNISEGGLYGTIPIGYGMAVGQRYICRLRTRELGPDGQQVVLRQGVVVRTELLLSDDGHQVGIAVRFCGRRGGFLATPAAV